MSEKKSSAQLVPQKHGELLGRKTSGETSGIPVVGYGGNNNLTPGNPGNKGGGRQPSKIREAARLAFAERLHVLTDIADNEEERSSDRIGAMKVLADTGGVDKIALTVDELPEEADTPERAARLWEMLERIKNVADLERLMVSHAKKQLGKGE